MDHRMAIFFSFASMGENNRVRDDDIGWSSLSNLECQCFPCEGLAKEMTSHWALDLI